MMNLAAIVARLDDAWRQLEAVTAATEGYWQDQTRVTFQTRFWSDLEANTRIYRGMLGDLAATLDSANRSVNCP